MLNNKDIYVNKIWCPCGKEYYVSETSPTTMAEAILYSQGYNHGLRATFEKVMQLMYEWELDSEQRSLVESNMKDLVNLDMPVTSPECHCPIEDEVI